jgi:hypothetical protein
MIRKVLSALFLCMLAFSATRAQVILSKSPQIPLVFEENRGQVAATHRFLFRHDGILGGIDRTGIDFRLPSADGVNRDLRLTLAGATPSASYGAHPLLGHSNYFLGNDPSRWLREVPQYARVRLPEVYPGIGLTVYGNGDELEHDFIVSPGVDAGQIRLRMDGADSVTMDSEGALEATAGNEVLTLRKPVAYQVRNEEREPVDAAFALKADGTVQFRLGAYDPTRELIIDPVFVFSTYLAGTGTDNATSVATDAAGNIYIAGSTNSSDFPVAHALQDHLSTCDSGYCRDVFVTKLDPSGSTILFSTYLGGPYDDFGQSIAVDKSGNVIVAGTSVTGGFPHAGALKEATSCETNWNCFFLASFSPDGSSLNYSGVIGGGQAFSSGREALALDAAGNAYLTGDTDDPNFQITAGTLASSVVGYPYDELFVLKVDPLGNLVYSTVVPGNASNDPATDNNQFDPGGIVVDVSGRATVSGTAYNGLPATAGVIGPSFPNSYGTAGFALRLNAKASAIDFATYLPGTDYGAGIAADHSGDFYIVGTTSEANLPVGSNAYQKFPGGKVNCVCTGGYVLRLSSDATSISAATYLNGTGGINGSSATSVSAVAFDGNGNVALAGMTGAADFPMLNPLVDTWEFTGSNSEMYLAELNRDLSSLLFGSFLNPTDGVYAGSTLGGIAVSGHDFTVVGVTNAVDFPTTGQSVEPTLPPPANPLSAPLHAFVSKIDLSTASGSACLSSHSVDFGKVQALSSGSVSLNITNCGNAPLHITGVTSSDPTVTADQACSTIDVGSKCTETLLFKPVKMQGIDGTVEIENDGPITKQVVTFQGTGTAAVIQASSVLDLGHALVGVTNPMIGLAVENFGDSPLTVSKVTVDGAGFSLGANGCQNIQYNYCSIGIVFAPSSAGPYAGALTIESNDPVTPVFQVTLTGAADSQYVAPVLSQTTLTALPVNNLATQFSVSGRNFYPASVVQVNGVAQQTAYVDETTLDVQLAAGTLTQIGDVPITVVNPAPGGVSNALPLTPYLPISIAAKALVYDPVGKLLYAAVPDGAASNADTVVPINPQTAALQSAIAVGKDPNALAISADGKYLFVALAGDHAIQRINLQNKTVEKTYALPDDPSFGKLTVMRMQVVPGTSTSVVVSLSRNASPSEAGAAMFNDSGMVNYLANDYDSHYLSIDDFAFTASGSTLYAIPFAFNVDFFTTLTVDSSGLHETQQSSLGSCCDEKTGSRVVSDGSYLYTNAGEVWDPTSQKLLGTYVPPGDLGLFYTAGVAPDSVSGRTFYLNQYSQSNGQEGEGSIQAFDQTTFSYIDQVPFQNLDSSAMGGLVKFGTDGFAVQIYDYTGFSPSSDVVILLRTSLSGTQTVPAPVMGTISPAIVSEGGKSLTLQVSGSKFVPKSVITWNGTALATTFVQDSMLTATVAATRIASAGTVNVAVKSPQPGGTSHALALTITSSGPAAALSATSLDFGSVDQGNSSSTKTIILANDGDTPLAISAISASGDFTATNTCGPLLGSAARCQIVTVFKPSTTGSLSGALTITDNAGSGTQAVQLTGTGTASATLSIAPASGGSTSTTVSSGGTASYKLAVTGSVGVATLTCAGAPRSATCTVSPASLTLVAGASSAFTVTVTTSMTTQASTVSRANRAPWLTLAALPLAWLLRRRRRIGAALLGLVLVATVGFGGCGGGGSNSTPPPPTTTTTPPGTYSLSLTATQGTASVKQSLTLVVQ